MVTAHAREHHVEGLSFTERAFVVTVQIDRYLLRKEQTLSLEK